MRIRSLTAALLVALAASVHAGADQVGACAAERLTVREQVQLRPLDDGTAEAAFVIAAMPGAFDALAACAGKRGEPLDAAAAAPALLARLRALVDTRSGLWLQARSDAVIEACLAGEDRQRVYSLRGPVGEATEGTSGRADLSATISAYTQQRLRADRALAAAFEDFMRSTREARVDVLKSAGPDAHAVAVDASRKVFCAAQLGSDPLLRGGTSLASGTGALRVGTQAAARGAGDEAF